MHQLFSPHQEVFYEVHFLAYTD